MCFFELSFYVLWGFRSIRSLEWEVFGYRKSVPLHCSVHFSAVFFLLQCLAFVVFLLTTAQRNVYFRTTVLVDKHKCGHDSVAWRL